MFKFFTGVNVKNKRLLFHIFSFISYGCFSMTGDCFNKGQGKPSQEKEQKKRKEKNCLLARSKKPTTQQSQEA
jgi:hypothetical protein